MVAAQQAQIKLMVRWRNVAYLKILLSNDE